MPVEILVALLTVVVAPLGRWGWTEWQKRRARGSYIARTAIYAELAGLRERTGAIRAFVMASENGGGVPTPEKRIVTSVLYESCRPEVYNVSDTWQKQPATEFVSSIVGTVLREGQMLARVSECPAGDFRTACDALGLTTVYFRHIALTPTKVLYLSLTWDDDTWLDAHDYDAARIAVSRLQNLLLG